MPDNSDDPLWRMLTQINETVGQMNSSLGASVEQNKTLFHRTDDHEERLRAMDKRLGDLSDTMEHRFEQTDAKIDRLSVKIDDAFKPSIWHRITVWISTHTHPLVVSLLTALGTGIGGYLIGMILH